MVNMSVLAVQRIHGVMKALNAKLLVIPAHKEPHILPNGAADLALRVSKACLTMTTELFVRSAMRDNRQLPQAPRLASIVHVACTPRDMVSANTAGHRHMQIYRKAPFVSHALLAFRRHRQGQRVVQSAVINEMQQRSK